MHLRNNLCVLFALRNLLWVNISRSTPISIPDKSHSNARIKAAINPLDKLASYQCTRSSIRIKSSLYKKLKESNRNVKVLEN
jgi:hypothetical protein